MTPDLRSYDYFVVAFSGGKDSLACLLHMLERQVPKDRIELWHHDVDGGGERFMDWACTRDYCRAVADAFGVKIYFSCKVGGFRREMMRDDSPTAPIEFETPTGKQVTGGARSQGHSTSIPAGEPGPVRALVQRLPQDRRGGRRAS